MAPLNAVNEQKPRQIAARILGQRRANGLFIEDLLEIALASASLSSADRGLCQEIVYGVVRWQATLDWLIARKTSGREQKPALQNLLRLGLYQIFWLDRIPDHAAVAFPTTPPSTKPLSRPRKAASARKPDSSTPSCAAICAKRTRPKNFWPT